MGRDSLQFAPEGHISLIPLRTREISCSAEVRVWTLATEGGSETDVSTLPYISSVELPRFVEPIRPVDYPARCLTEDSGKSLRSRRQHAGALFGVTDRDVSVMEAEVG